MLTGLHCDGKRPICGQCADRRSNCSYITISPSETRTAALRREIVDLRQRVQDQNELLEHLRSLPCDEAIELLRDLKTVPDVSTFLASYKGSSHGQQRLSNLATARSVSPPTQTNLEFELMVQHKTAYPRLVPLDIALINLDSLVKPAAAAGERRFSQTSLGDYDTIDFRASSIIPDTASKISFSSLTSKSSPLTF